MGALWDADRMCGVIAQSGGKSLAFDLGKGRSKGGQGGACHELRGALVSHRSKRPIKSRCKREIDLEHR